MLAKVHSGAVLGVNGLSVMVEVDLALGLPMFTTVGLPDGSVRESKERVKAAIKNCGYDFPPKRITVNLAPADIKKGGAGFDLPMALGILAATELFKPDLLDQYAVVGELSLDGSVRSVPGVLPVTLNAKENGLKGILVPEANQLEAAVVQGIDVIAVGHLHHAVEFLAGKKSIDPIVLNQKDLLGTQYGGEVDFQEVKGQEHVKRAFEIAASGGHNIALKGPPGSGKTMLTRRLATILPPMSFEEALETTKIYSIVGKLSSDIPLITTRPFRAPHHTISDAGLIGGGQHPRPGEVSLAHNGVLFLDELPEFKKHVLEVLRQPLEAGDVSIARAQQTLKFPARFVLVVASNPCPCGYLGDKIRECKCTPQQIQRYNSKVSGPLLDRIDIHLEVAAVPFKDISDERQGESSREIKKRVDSCRKIQENRYHSLQSIHCNAQIGPAEVEKYCKVDATAKRLLQRSVEKLGLSARGYHRILKIARTIADMDNKELLELSHIAEAVQYRRNG
ncbi:Mg chelatase-related protein [Desulfocapsa sulfexigens DSM 10523]|uniref:Mg chelatase-related protein n=1 Tax=Desulfocapsa sulfexigens (strain DSM 10523 / SB164P1) TaxID=1167006 RepID=M1P8E8_DESSD|nr:YifB family Mg chelatase-like AAA ATPase [Desulfocapsa sulfexigens]AGF79758.1 Mg chelatase-related protein [Desulfocapsa sulfexigens DSM 10523]